jgi:hypothetical protein
MKITRQTETELRAEHRPRFLPLLIAALLVGVIVEELIRNPAPGLDLAAAGLGIGVGVVLFLIALRGSEVRLDAAAGTASVRTVGPFAGKTAVLRLDDVRDVAVKTGRGGSGSRLVFVAGEPPSPSTGSSPSAGSVRRGPVATPGHSTRTPRDREVADAMRAWMSERGYALVPREGELRVGDRVRVSAPPGESRAWLPADDALEGRLERFVPTPIAGSLGRAAIRLDVAATLAGVEASWLLLTQRYDPPRWFDQGEVHVVACPREPRRWTVGLDRSARALEGTGWYAADR